MKMNSNDIQLINTTIDFFVNKGMMFTAFDVTKAVRKLGANVLHKDVKGLVHSFKFPASYTRESVDIAEIVFGPGSNSATAFIYRPVSSRVEDYNPVDLSDSTQSTTQTAAIVVNKAPDNVPSTDLPDGVYYVNLDKRNRFRLKKKVADKSGLTPGEMLHVSISDDSIELSRINPGYCDSIITLDEYNNVNIYANALLKAFGDIPNRVECISTPGNIVIKKYD